MKREEVKKIFPEATDEQVDSILNTVGAEINKNKNTVEKLQSELKQAKADYDSINGQFEELKKSNATAEDWKKKFDDIVAENQRKEDEAKQAKADEELTAKIVETFGDKEFTSDYVKTGIIADMKKEIAKPENKGKGYSELFEALTKDKDGIFKTGNQIGMGGINSGANTGVTDEQARAVMGLPPIK